MQPGGGACRRSASPSPLLAAFGVAAVTITIRQIGRTERTPTTVLWFTCFSMAVTGLLMPFYGRAHDGRLGDPDRARPVRRARPDLPDLRAALRAGLGGGAVRLYAIALGGAARLGLWDTHPPATTWAGAAVIIASGLYTLYREHVLGREKEPPRG